MSISAGGSGSVSQSGLRSLLQDLNQVNPIQTALPCNVLFCVLEFYDPQVPLAVQGGEAYGGVEVAVKACFNGVRSHRQHT